jgi:thymidylate synthase
MADKLFRTPYCRLLTELLSGDAVTETNARTGQRISVVDPTSFSLDLSEGLLPVCGIRKTFPRTAAAEVAWFMLGRKDVSFIKTYAPIWDKFVEDDGFTIEAAYGYRWRSHFGRDQIGEAINALVANPSDRRIFICAWDPAADGLGQPSRNVPCPVGFTLSITGGRLNSTLLIRSSDVFVGLPYDVMGHALLMQAIASSINARQEERDQVRLGTMHVSLAHPHLYEVHHDMAARALWHSPHVDNSPAMPDWGVRRIVTLPHEYVALVRRLADEQAADELAMFRPELVV